MNQKFIQSTLLGGLLVGLLAFGNFSANAAGFNKNIANNGEVYSKTDFYKILKNTKVSDFANTFGTPDNIVTIRDLSGDVTGVVWVYRDSVASKNKKLDANFMLVKGQLKYVTLTTAS